MEFEPYRIKVIERINSLDRAERARVLRKAYYNPFLLPARAVAIDLISDSGTAAMSSDQWACLQQASEAFAFQESYDELRAVARKLTGFLFIVPVHQGRAAEHILFEQLLAPHDMVLGNSFFETTEANIRAARALTYSIPHADRRFPGNIDLDRLEKLLKTGQINSVLITATSNANGGQPVSLENISQASRLAKKFGALLIIDACRFAENAYLNKERLNLAAPAASVARKIFDQADIIYLSSKKDGLANAGGFIGLRSKKLYEALNEKVLLCEGFPSHGGLAGRDLAAMARGLIEAVDDEYLRHRLAQVRFLGTSLKRNGLPVFEPFGGHALVIKTARLRVPYPAFALAAAAYREGGIRGGVFGDDFRLALPRRVYTNEHLSFVAATVGQVYRKRKLPVLKLIYQPRSFFNFRARFQLEAACRGTGSKARRRAE